MEYTKKDMYLGLQDGRSAGWTRVASEPVRQQEAANSMPAVSATQPSTRPMPPVTPVPPAGEMPERSRPPVTPVPPVGALPERPRPPVTPVPPVGVLPERPRPPVTPVPPVGVLPERPRPPVTPVPPIGVLPERPRPPVTPVPPIGEMPECGFCITLAMGYVPMQEWRMLYEPEDGFSRGTIFEELDLPFAGKGDCRRERARGTT